MAMSVPHLQLSFRTTSVLNRMGHKWVEDAPEECEIIRRRLMDHVGCPLSHIEPVEVVRYNAGAEYQLHYDGHWRTDTILVYLNDDYRGGRTTFPNIGEEIRPVVGHCVLWSNASKGQNLHDYAHQIPPVESGTKWIAVTWAWETPYDPAIPSGRPPRTGTGQYRKHP